MKKLLLSAVALATLSLSASAQRMTLSEEFTGENCGPCASTNPTFWTLLNGSSNPSKIIHLAYMCPIPSSGWFYLQTKTLSDARQSYYSVPFAPYHRYDGHVPNASASSPGHPGNFTQTDIDNEYAIASPFTITASNAWNATFDSCITTVNIACVSAWTGGTVKLRAALAQTLDFATSPGSNGETHFENVVRAMYPDAGGTSLASTWTVGMTQTIVLRGAVPSFVLRDKSPFMTVWIQDDASSTKYIAQAAKATPLPPIPNDAALTSSTSSLTGVLTCNANGTFTVPSHTVALKNAGSNVMTSATIYYKVDGATLSTYSWSGSLAVASSTTVTVPATTATIAGASYHYIYDSVGNVNSSTDQNYTNNVTGTSFFVESTNGIAMPYTTSFEGTDYTAHYSTNAGSNAWVVSYNTSAPLGHTGSYAVRYNNYITASAGVPNVYTLPVVTTSSNCAIDFWVADCQIATTNTDKLEVVYSTNCGSSWTSLWNLSGTALATVPADATYYFYPTLASQYKMHSVSLNTVPAGSIVGFRATSGGGQNLWLDDVNLRTGPAVVSVANVAEVTPTDISIFPNPAADEATISFSMEAQSNVQVQVIDAVGRTVSVLANEQMAPGFHSFNLNTASFATGTYNVIIITESGKFTSRFSVAK